MDESSNDLDRETLWIALIRGQVSDVRAEDGTCINYVQRKEKGVNQWRECHFVGATAVSDGG